MRRVACCLTGLLLALPTAGRAQQPDSPCCKSAACQRTACCKADCSTGGCPAAGCSTAGCASGCSSACCATAGCSSAGGVSASCPIADCPDSKVEHLLKAAHHLELAGLDKQARDIRQQANRLLDVLLKEKTAQLKRLHAEVQALRSISGKAEQVMIHVKIVEVPHTNLRKLGLDFELNSS